jgi:hypothetical protein
MFPKLPQKLVRPTRIMNSLHCSDSASLVVAAVYLPAAGTPCSEDMGGGCGRYRRLACAQSCRSASPSLPPRQHAAYLAPVVACRPAARPFAATVHGAASIAPGFAEPLEQMEAIGSQYLKPSLSLTQ